MTSSILLLFVVGFFFGKIGDVLPIWKDYFGGGLLLAFLGASFFVAQQSKASCIYYRRASRKSRECYGKSKTDRIW